MKNLFCLSVALFFHISASAQQNDNSVEAKRNTLYIEAFGQGSFNSLSFDRLYRLDKNVKSSITVGLTVMPWQSVPKVFMKYSPNNFSVFGAPVSYNWLFGKYNHHLELGVGLSYLQITQQPFKDNTHTYTEQFVYFTPKFSYRYQSANGGLFFRMSLTPPIAVMTKNSFGGEYYLRDAHTPFSYGSTVTLCWVGTSIGWTIK